MTDQIPTIDSPEITPEERAKLDAKAEKREVDKLRKRKERASLKADQIEDERVTAKRRATEEASREVERIRREREGDIFYNLSGESFTEFGPNLPWEDVELERKIDDFLALKKFENFNQMYHGLAMTSIGCLILKHYNVPMLPDLPDGWRYHEICQELNVCHLPTYSPRFEIWEAKTSDELLEYWQKHERYYTQPPRSQQSSSGETTRNVEELIRSLRETNDQKRKAYAEKIREYERLFKSGREARRKAAQEPAIGN